LVFGFSKPHSLDRHAKAFADLMREWQLEAILSKLTKGRPEVLVLAPTKRSLIHG